MVQLMSDDIINFAASHHKSTHRGMRKTAGRVGMRAKSNLADHHHDGHAEIQVTRGGTVGDTEDVDLLVVLSDENGLGAAMSIEFGREEGTSSSWGPMDATNILHEASQIKGRGNGRVKRSERARTGPNGKRGR